MESEVTRETDEIIEMASRRVVIEIGTASFRATRGYSYAAVLADEIAFWRDDTSANLMRKSCGPCALACSRSPVPCC